MNDLNLKDFKSIADFAPDLADMITEICSLNVAEITKMIDSPKNTNNELMQEISPDKLDEMIVFYNSIIDIFADKELYEECVKTKYVVESLKKYKEKVGSY
jgi:hypothetical protein